MNWKKTRNFLIGKPIKTIRETKERLSRVTGLAVFASDALSSVAYAIEEILLILIIGGVWILSYSPLITAAIIILAFIVIISYRQTIKEYPTGAGSYIVSRDNLPEKIFLTAAAALLIDYILTVSVSISAGVAAITSAFSFLHPFKVWIALAFIWVIALINLRGVKQAGAIFSVPVYLFVFSIGIMIIVGLKNMFLGIPADSYSMLENTILPSVSLFLIIRAFSSGCVALTGIEAIANGVGAFKKPEHVNARAALLWLGILMAFLFGGVAILANYYGIIPQASETVLSQIGRNVFDKNFMYFMIQFMTMGILVLAANTSFNDFPRILYFLAADKYAPRQFLSQGTRLAFSNGIVLLAIISSILIAVFGADTHALIPLYAVGVFLCFTISQLSMVKHWFKKRTKHYFLKAGINLFGALATCFVLIILVVMKFIHGAWLVIIVIPLIIKGFLKIRKHYDTVARQLALDHKIDESFGKDKTVILLVSEVHQGTKLAYEVALNLKPTRLFALHVSLSNEETREIKKQWRKHFPRTQLSIIESQYRDILNCILRYVEEIDKKWKHDCLIIVIPEFVPKKLWHHLLHGQTASRLHYALRSKPHIQILEVPFRLRY